MILVGVILSILILLLLTTAWQLHRARRRVALARAGLHASFAARHDIRQSESPALPHKPRDIAAWLLDEEQNAAPEDLATADAVARARRRYNAAVNRHNDHLQYGPGRLLAWLGCRPEPYYEGDELAQPESRDAAGA